MGFRYRLLQAITIVYFILLGYVFFNVWRLRAKWWLKLLILLSTVLLPPVGFFWYKWRRKKDKKRLRTEIEFKEGKREI
jgi:membrane protein DedA with SNARE-associated domain